MTTDAVPIPCEPPNPPPRGDWWIVLYVPHGRTWWTLFRLSQSTAITTFDSESEAKEYFKMIHPNNPWYEVVRIPGNGTPQEPVP